jgi:hypothetical protein
VRLVPCYLPSRINADLKRGAELRKAAKGLR